MPRTLVLTNDFPPRIGGIESFVAEVCELLDHDVVVLASGPPGAQATDASRGYPVHRSGALLLPTPLTAWHAVGLMRSVGADRVVLGAAAPLGLLAPTLRRGGARRIVGLTHGHEVWWSRVPAARGLLHRIGESCDHLTTISDFTTAQIGQALSPAARSRLLRLAPPVDLDVFRPGAGPVFPPRCIAVGRLVVQKGVDLLLTAWRRVLDAWPEGRSLPELVVVGDGPQWAALQRQAVGLGLGSTVRWTGPLLRADVVHELRTSQVFALPVRTRWGGLNPEGLGLAAVEAAACGLPVVVGDSGGASETVRDGVSGHVVPTDGPYRLADVIRALLLDPVRAAGMGAAGRQHVTRRFGTEEARLTLRGALGLG